MQPLDLSTTPAAMSGSPKWLAPDTVAERFNALPDLLDEAAERRCDKVIAALKQDLLDQMSELIDDAREGEKEPPVCGGLGAVQGIWDEDFDYFASTWDSERMRKALGFKPGDPTLVICTVAEEPIGPITTNVIRVQLARVTTARVAERSE